MQPLNKTLRNKLEKTIKEAREVAEFAARAALEQLGVGEAAPFAHLSKQDRELRRQLRVHGRQLGDSLNGGKIQTMDRLIEEVAYEHWHRMLFARFLAENNLLMFSEEQVTGDRDQGAGNSAPCPLSPAPSFADAVAITLEEADDLAQDYGLKNGWELSAKVAARMLPQIFRLDSPVFQLALPPEHQQKLERLVADLELPVFTASDSLGWVYQFWQAKKKDEVNASEVKIGARELPAVTQLFTEPYMVSFLLDNSLGAWWVGKVAGIRGQGAGEEELKPGAREILQTAKTEDELREFFAIPGVPLTYLRFVRDERAGERVQGAGDPAPCSLPPDTFLWTPAAGTFDGWPEQLADLKTLDPCCGSGHFLVAAFLMLVPMRMERDGLSAREAVDAVLRENIHGLELDQRCVELAAFALALTAWKYPSAGGYRVLPELNVACSGLSISAKKEEWLALAGANTNLRIALEGLYKQFKDAPVLGSLINPETSLGKGSLFELRWEEVGPLLNKALAGEKDNEKTEMGVVARGLAKASTTLGCKYSFVFTNVPYLGRGKQNNTLFDFLERNYPNSKWDLATAFIDRCIDLSLASGLICVVSPQNWYFSARYKSFRNTLLSKRGIVGCCRLGSGAFSSITGEVVKVGLSLISASKVKNLFLVDANDTSGTENKAFDIIDSKISLRSISEVYDAPDHRIMFGDHASDGVLLENLATCYQGLVTGDSNRFLTCFWEILPVNGWNPFVNARKGSNLGLNNYILWEQGRGRLHEYAKETRARLHDMHESGNLAWGSKGIAIGRVTRQVAPYFGHQFDNSVAVITPKKTEDLNGLYAFTNSPEFQQQLQLLDQKLSLTNATILKVIYDSDKWQSTNGFPELRTDDPTQWAFHGHPISSEEPLHVAVARLLGYRWPAELDASMELAAEQREWVKRCEALASYADDDGIVCIPPVRGEASASDRLLNLLAAAYGDAWSNDTLASLLKSADHAGKTLETWLREKFFTQHCKLFQHRPFIWHIWDGLRDGFAALINYHKLDAKLLETLIYTYLGDWISRQKQDIASHVDGAQERLASAEALKKKLELILEGEAPYDIFVRWKPLEKQPIGWDPDLGDGVRLNIRPFLTVPDVGKKGAGVLRDKPNINWNKDRGKDVESAPWYHVFDGDRINDHHLTLAEKRRVSTENTEGTEKRGK
jgi:hypothetical protein